MSTTTTRPDLSTAPAWAWDQITELVCRAQAEAWDRGFSAGWAAALAQAEQGVVNRQIAEAGVRNISVEVARAKADGREPRLYAQGVAR